MPSSQAVRRYAGALFSLAQEDANVDAVRAEVRSLRELIDENRELRVALLTPLHPAKERKGVLRALASQISLSPTVLHFLSFLIDQRRLLDFASIQSEFDRLADEATGLLKAEITSAAPLDQQRQEELRRVLADRTGRRIELHLQTDPELIGGLVAKVAGTVYDGSVRSQLERLQNSLSKEA